MNASNSSYQERLRPDQGYKTKPQQIILLCAPTGEYASGTYRMVRDAIKEKINPGRNVKNVDIRAYVPMTCRHSVGFAIETFPEVAWRDHPMLVQPDQGNTVIRIEPSGTRLPIGIAVQNESSTIDLIWYQTFINSVVYGESRGKAPVVICAVYEVIEQLINHLWGNINHLGSVFASRDPIGFQLADRKSQDRATNRKSPREKRKYEWCAPWTVPSLETDDSSDGGEIWNESAAQVDKTAKSNKHSFTVHPFTQGPASTIWLTDLKAIHEELCKQNIES